LRHENGQTDKQTDRHRQKTYGHTGMLVVILRIEGKVKILPRLSIIGTFVDTERQMQR